MGEFVQVLTTAGSEEEAGRIAELLVERRLAACVQVVSRYRWRGAVEEEREWQCLAKTTRAATRRSRRRFGRFTPASA